MNYQNLVDAVAIANVIIINDYVAVALKYDENIDLAPVIVVKAIDEIALQIKAIGCKKALHIVHNSYVAESLYSSCEIGQCIPDRLYGSIGEILANIYRSETKKHWPEIS